MGVEYGPGYDNRNARFVYELLSSGDGCQRRHLYLGRACICRLQCLEETLMNARPLNEIRGWLKAGVRPDNLPGATYLNGGCDRYAYRVGAFVVKAASHYMQTEETTGKSGRGWRYLPDGAMVHMPVRKAPTARVAVPDGSVYEIQRYYPGLLTDRAKATAWMGSPDAARGAIWGFDLHLGNLGLDRNGKIVAFDW